MRVQQYAMNPRIVYVPFAYVNNSEGVLIDCKRKKRSVVDDK
jgi:hypothetical protein